MRCLWRREVEINIPHGRILQGAGEHNLYSDGVVLSGWLARRRSVPGGILRPGQNSFDLSTAGRQSRSRLPRFRNGLRSAADARWRCISPRDGVQLAIVTPKTDQIQRIRRKFKKRCFPTFKLDRCSQLVIPNGRVQLDITCCLFAELIYF